MAIEQIPGVGPQNTDIATAVAAAVPTIAAITSSITTNAASAGLTNASITSAGNAAGWGATGPTTTQIAAAVPTLAQITSAVTTNAASAGVTNASITSIVAANAGSPFGGTWADLGETSAPGATSVTISSLGGYKFLRLHIHYTFSSFDSALFRINNDSSNSYRWVTGQRDNSEYANLASYFRFATSSTPGYHGTIEFEQANNTSIKKFWTDQGARGQSSVYYAASLGSGVWLNTAAITSIVITTGGNPFAHFTCQVWGAN